MNAKDLLDRLRADVNATSRTGQGSISVVELDRYLAQWEPYVLAAPPDQLTLDRFRAQFEQGMAKQQHEHEMRLEEFKSTNKAGREAMKASILINGGAAVALLAFLGHLATVAKGSVPGFTLPLGFYIAGVLSGALAMGIAYLAQAMNALRKYPLFKLWNTISILATIMAYAAFAVGGWLSFTAFRSM